LEELLATYQRPWPEEDPGGVRAGYTTALEDGADPGEILTGAKLWVAAVEARYLPKLPKWLARKSWLKDPTAKPKAQRTGKRESQRESKLSDADIADAFSDLGDAS
jgi:hypothetical protein